MPNPLTYPVAIELDGIYYISLADDRQFPTYTHSRKIGGAGAAPINITVTLGDSETAPTVGSHIVITVQPQSASRYRTVGGIIMEITQLGSPKRTFQINGLAYEAYLSAVKIPRYSSVNAVTIVTAIEAILTKAYLMGYATDAYDLTTFGDTSATAIVNTDINITAEQAINQVCAQFGFRWYVSTGDWLNKENIGSFIAELVIVKIGYEITGPIDTLDQADIECPPDTMPDVRNVQPTVSIPRPIVVEVASDVESLEAKDQLAELVDVYEIPFLPNSVKRAFIIEIDGVNEVTTVNITSADGSETVSLTINPTPLDPLADPPDFGGFDVLIDTRESRRSILLENDVSSYLASPTTQGFVNGTYTTFRAYGKVTDTTWQGILNTRQVWGDSTTPYFQEQIIEPTAITQTACEALGQSILDAREPYFRKLTFNTTEKGIELLQTITYTNTDLGLSGEKIIITEISENPIDNPDSTELSLREIIELSVTCEPVPRMTPEQMSIQQAIAVASQPANRPIAAGEGGGGGTGCADLRMEQVGFTGDAADTDVYPSSFPYRPYVQATYPESGTLNKAGVATYTIDLTEPNYVPVSGDKLFLLLVAYFSGENQSDQTGITEIRLVDEMMSSTVVLHWEKSTTAGSAGVNNFDYTRFVEITSYVGQVLTLEFDFDLTVGAAVGGQSPDHGEIAATLQISCGIFIESRSASFTDFTGDVFDNETRAGIVTSTGDPDDNGSTTISWDSTGIDSTALYRLRLRVTYEPTAGSESCIVYYGINGLVYEFDFSGESIINEEFQTTLRLLSAGSPTSTNVDITINGTNCDATVSLTALGIDFYLPDA